MNKAHFFKSLHVDQSSLAFTCKDSDCIIVLGTMLSRDNKELLDEVLQAQNNGAKIAYLFTMEDGLLCDKATFFSRYETGSEEGVLGMLAKALCFETLEDGKLKEYFEELDEGYISAESNIGEEEIEEIASLCNNSKNPMLIVGEDIFAHKRVDNIAMLVSVCANNSSLKVLAQSQTVSTKKQDIPEEIEDLRSFDGTVVYTCRALNDEETHQLIGSSQFQVAAKVKDKQPISIMIAGQQSDRVFVLDETLKGTIALMPSSDIKSQTYRYAVAKIVKREVQ
ncbi:MAG: hypothetical protein PHW07_00010 [Sulfurospirillaceae bacterium]|nr:hypothetical protein [Sulfurospirillaceae bacterium]